MRGARPRFGTTAGSANDGMKPGPIRCGACLPLNAIRLCSRVAWDAFYRFNADDGWAIASHIALSVLMSMFPFLILVTAIAGFVGSKNLADEVAQLIIAAWPQEVSGGIAGEIHSVLTTARGDILTVGALFAIYFSSSGVERSASKYPTTSTGPASACRSPCRTASALPPFAGNARTSMRVAVQRPSAK